MKHGKRVTSFVVSLFAMLSFGAFAADAKTCQLTLGYDSWEPYQYLDIGNEVRGMDVELVRMVADRMPCKINYAQGTWIDLLPKLKQGEIDLLLGASKTPDREKYALFSDAYRGEEFMLYIRKEDEELNQLNSFTDFIGSGRKLGVVEDYFYGDELSSLQDREQADKQFVGAIMGELNIARLLDEDIDAFVEDSFVGASMLRRKGLNTLIVPQGIKVKTGDVYIMFSRNSVSPQLVAKFNKALAEVKNSGEYEALIKLYKQ